MSQEPVLIYSHRIDPVGVVGVLADCGAEVEIVGTPAEWTDLIVQSPRKLLRRRARLVVHQQVEYYRGPDWTTHLRELWTYLARFPLSPHKAELLEAIRGFRFALSLADAKLDLQRDRRLPWVHAICAHLDGVLFTPTMVLDKRGRILLSGYQDFPADTEAELPEIAPPDQRIEVPQLNIDEVLPPDTPLVEPPDARTVAARAMVLAALAERGMIENEHTSKELAEQAREQLLEWLHTIEADWALEPQERAVLEAPFGSLDQQTMTDSVWGIEGLAVLLWALGLFELPSYEELVNPEQIWEAVAIYEDDASRAILAQAQLRSPEELAAYRTHATMANWRLRNFRLHPGAVDLVEMSRGCWIGTFDLSRFEIVKSDLAVDGKPIDRADPARVNLCESIAIERHRASNWLIGWNSPSYANTDIST